MLAVMSALIQMVNSQSSTQSSPAQQPQSGPSRPAAAAGEDPGVKLLEEQNAMLREQCENMRARSAQKRNQVTELLQRVLADEEDDGEG